MVDRRRDGNSRAALLWRGLRVRCPACGAGGLSESMIALRERCPSCGLRLDRGEHDFWIGAWMLNLVAVETVFVLGLAFVVVLIWPDVPWRALTAIGVVGMLALPILLFRMSRTLWLAIDMTFQPERPGDFGEAGR